MTPWYDTHVHLDRYPEGERRALLERAEEAGVAIIAVATDLASSAEVLRLLGSHRALVGGAVGVHPKSTGTPAENALRQLVRERGILAIGECGFDASGPRWSAQADAFETQCRIAREIDRVVVLHIDGDGAFEQLKAHAEETEGLRVVRHYFSGDSLQAEWHRERGHYLSFGNPLFRQPHLQDTARTYPRELLLIETDSYPLPGRATEPADVARIGETLAGIRGWTVDEAREQLARNTVTAFGLDSDYAP